MQKHFTKRNIAIAVVIIVVLAIAGFFIFKNHGIGTTESDQTKAVRAFVTEFGTKLQNVSLTAPEADAKAQIQKEYGKYITPELMQYWMDNIKSAPGRYVSSPWPDHIEISEIRPEGTSFTVIGQVIYLSSQEVANGGVAARQQVVFGIENRDGKLLITEYQGF